MADKKDPVLPEGWTASERDDHTWYASKWHRYGQLEVTGADLAELAKNAAASEKAADKANPAAAL